MSKISKRDLLRFKDKLDKGINRDGYQVFFYGKHINKMLDTNKYKNDAIFVGTCLSDVKEVKVKNKWE